VAQVLYRLCKHLPELLTSWSWTCYYEVLEQSSADTTMRAHVALTLAQMLGLQEASRRTFFTKYGVLEAATKAELALMLDEGQAVASMYQQTATNSNPKTCITITGEHLSPLTVDVCGILLPTEHLQLIESESTSCPLIHTPNTRANLHAIALAVSLGRPLLVEGPFGSGKTCLIEEAARLIGCKGR
jgi:hypothetical protein